MEELQMLGQRLLDFLVGRQVSGFRQVQLVRRFAFGGMEVVHPFLGHDARRLAAEALADFIGAVRAQRRPAVAPGMLGNGSRRCPTSRIPALVSPATLPRPCGATAGHQNSPSRTPSGAGAVPPSSTSVPDSDVPSMKYSSIAFGSEAAAGFPVSRLMWAVTIPAGGTSGFSGR